MTSARGYSRAGRAAQRRGLLCDQAWTDLASAIEQSKVAKRERLEPVSRRSVLSRRSKRHRWRSEEVECIAVARPFSRTARKRYSSCAAFPVSRMRRLSSSSTTPPTPPPLISLRVSSTSAVLSVDRAGDLSIRRSVSTPRAASLTPVRELYFPDSLGDLFNRVTELLGYQSRSDEHKVQWISATAEPAYKSFHGTAEPMGLRLAADSIAAISMPTASRAEDSAGNFSRR